MGACVLTHILSEPWGTLVKIVCQMNTCKWYYLCAQELLWKLFSFWQWKLTVSMFGTNQNVFLNSRSHWNWIKFAKQRKCHVPGTECFWHSHRDQHRHRSTWSRISPQPAVGNLSQNSCLPYTAGIGWRGLEKQCKVLIKPQPFHQGHKQANQIYRQYVCVREQSAPVKIKWPVFSKVPEDQQRELNSYFLALYTRLMRDHF